eukprot:5384869-Pleurochrysis_carterae.AAC.1
MAANGAASVTLRAEAQPPTPCGRRRLRTMHLPAPHRQIGRQDTQSGVFIHEYGTQLRAKVPCAQQ